MPAIRSATATAFFLFDVAEQIDMAALQEAIGGSAASARIVPKSGAPSYFQYATPPVVVDGDVLGCGEVDGFRARVKFFDYGVLSLALTRQFSGDWPELIDLAQRYIENEALERRAEEVCRGVASRLSTAFSGTRDRWLSEDYLVFAVTAFSEPLTVDDLIARRSEEIALLLRGERQPLSRQEQEEVLRNRLSYLTTDLVVPTWNAAFVYDTETGAQAALEIFEFANSQLLEFRYYDELLDSELGRIYSQLKAPRWFDWLGGRGHIRAARQLHALFIDVNEIVDRTENALKMVGDIYAARLFHLATTRVGLGPWKASVEEKLKTLDDIYRFAVEQIAISRGHFLEATIVLILVFELVLFFMGIMT
ncbi:MAG TPA: hypothetical protein VLD67_21665 [Vicinamibacterales bacterium]|nr:hypothetical protein [Vicinamibacterales bacterium]